MPQNKAHKQKFSSKHAIAEKQQGRVVGARPMGPKQTVGVNNKERMRQAAIALREKKNAAVVYQRRVGTVGPPKIIGFVPLNETANANHVAREFHRVATGEEPSTTSLPHTIVAKQLKQRFTLVVENDGNEQRISDVAKVSDILVLVLDCSQGVQDAIKELGNGEDADDGQLTHVSGSTWFDDIGLCVTDTTREIISTLNAQGLPSVMVVLQGLESFENPRKKQKTLKVHRRYCESVFGNDVKVVSHENDMDVQLLIRSAAVAHLRQLKWREIRPYIVAEEVNFNPDLQELEIRGYIHGGNIGADQLLHLTDHGTFQIQSITDFGDPHPLNRASATPQGVVGEVLEEARESLACIQASDTVEDEGLATEEDVRFEQQAATKKIRVPAGVSEYQAAWYEFEDGNEIVDEPVIPPTTDDDFVDIDAMTFRTTQTDLDFLKAADVIRHERMTDEERAQEAARLKDMSEEEMWNPDMVDTPVSLPARQRFSKYRGMKSFQNGVWDVNENLPIQYGHIFKLQGYNRVRDASIAKCQSGAAQEGLYATIKLPNVTSSAWEVIKNTPLLIASAQLEHEQKWSVLHFQVQRNSDLEGAIKSKTPVLVHLGFRKFYVSPIFSDPTVGDRTKFARYFHEGEKFRVASFYGPISFLPCPILMFLVPSLEEQAEANSLRLACFGGALPPNPDLLILKRAVLTGRVAMINKKHSVIKYMFFNEDDVNWFKPVDLYTKLGRRGKIQKAVGTHGLFKVALNDMIMQHDVICMDLFKRVFPKWTTVPFSATELQAPHEDDNEEEV